MITEKTIDEIKSASAIESVVGEFVNLKKRGSNFLGLCPFHNERTPSFSVSPAKGIFKCFGCGKSGDSVKFIMEHEHYTYPEALRYLAGKYKINIDESEEIVKAKSEKDKLYEVLEFAQKYFRENILLPGNPGAVYAAERAINENLSPGFAPEAGKSLLDAARENGFSVDILLKAGLIAQNERGNFYNYFRYRLMLPFYDLSNRVCGFTGRSLKNDKRLPKYLNSPETDVFHKGNTVFAINQAKHAIIHDDECILVEGNIDVSTFHNRNLKNTVCSSGTALTTEQVRLIRRFSDNLTFVYDGDDAGRKAALKSIDIALKEGMNVWLVKLPDDEDPDKFAMLLTDQDIKEFIEQNRKDFVEYRFMIADQETLNDTQKRSELAGELVKTCTLVPDEITRNAYIHDIAKKFEISERNLKQSLKKQLPTADESIKYKGFFAFENATESIKENNKVVILGNNQEVLKSHLDDVCDVIGLPCDFVTDDEVKELGKLTKNVTIAILYKWEYITEEDNSLISLAYKFIENGFNVSVHTEESRVSVGDDDVPFMEMVHVPISYIDYFVRSQHKFVFDSGRNSDDRIKKLAVEKSAELLSKLDSTTITLKTKWVSDIFGLNQASFNKILKPYLDKKKNKTSLHNEDIIIDDTKYIFDIENLPPYVDKKFFYKYGFFPVENKQGKKIFYMFRDQNGVLVKVGNFYMEPLFQVWNLDAQKNKRVVRLNHAELGKSEYVEMPSGGMMDFAIFKKFLWNQGGYVFSRGKNFHHEIILESIALQFPKAYEFETFGWQSENFFAFANGIYANDVFTPVDDFGLVSHNANTYYSPAYSVIYKDQRNDNDKYKNDRYLVYKEKQETTWERWCQLMTEVYKHNQNGMWSVLFTIMAAHRSVIFHLERYFTAPFFIGPTESGKSRIAESICAPFMYGAPLFNLNSGTDAAFFTILERYRDVPVPLEEYNDYQISDIKFQGLKAAVYDSEGKTKRKDASSKELDVSAVNCAPIPLGQEAPERDDGSLGNRVVILHVPKNDNWTEDEIKVYQELKTAEKNGLTNIVIEILKRRPLIKQHFGKILRSTQKKLKEDLNASGSLYQTRVLNTVSLFVSMMKFWEEHSPELPLTFSFDSFYEIAKAKIISQSESITNTNRVSVFFETLGLLLNKEHNGIQEDREFKIETCETVLIHSSKNEPKEKKLEGKSKVIFLRMGLLHPLYREINKMEALKANALMMYLRDHPSYIGWVKSTRFTWNEVKEIPTPSGFPEKHVVTASANTSAIALYYDKIGVDLQKFKMPDQDNAYTPSPITRQVEQQKQINFNQEEEVAPF